MVLGSVASAGLAIFTATRVAAAEVSGFFALGARRGERLRHRVVAGALRRGPSRRASRSAGDAGGPADRVGRRGADPHLPAAGRRGRRRSRRHTHDHLAARRCASSARAPSASSAIWTLAKLARPVVGGLVTTIARVTARRRPATSAIATSRRAGSSASRSSASRSRAGSPDRFARGTPLGADACTLTLIAVPFVLIVGFLIAGDLRLHGRTHRRVEQPDLRRRHPRRSSRAPRS